MAAGGTFPSSSRRRANAAPSAPFQPPCTINARDGTHESALWTHGSNSAAAGNRASGAARFPCGRFSEFIEDKLAKTPVRKGAHTGGRIPLRRFHHTHPKSPSPNALRQRQSGETSSTQSPSPEHTASAAIQRNHIHSKPLAGTHCVSSNPAKSYTPENAAPEQTAAAAIR